MRLFCTLADQYCTQRPHAELTSTKKEYSAAEPDACCTAKNFNLQADICAKSQVSPHVASANSDSGAMLSNTGKPHARNMSYCSDSQNDRPNALSSREADFAAPNYIELFRQRALSDSTKFRLKKITKKPYFCKSQGQFCRKYSGCKKDTKKNRLNVELTPQKRELTHLDLGRLQNSTATVPDLHLQSQCG